MLPQHLPLRLLSWIKGKTLKHIRHIFHDIKAATAIEYGLIAALIAVAAIAAMQGLGNNLKKTFNNVQSNVKVG